jgi:hypothetical protein
VRLTLDKDRVGNIFNPPAKRTIQRTYGGGPSMGESYGPRERYQCPGCKLWIDHLDLRLPATQGQIKDMPKCHFGLVWDRLPLLLIE